MVGFLKLIPIQLFLLHAILHMNWFIIVISLQNLSLINRTSFKKLQFHY